MEKICIFCGRSLGRWERKSLYCGNGTQTVCKECYEKYSPMTNVERGLLAWEAGQAESQETAGTLGAGGKDQRGKAGEGEGGPGTEADRENMSPLRSRRDAGCRMHGPSWGRRPSFSVTGTVLPADPWTCRSSGARTAEGRVHSEQK